MVPLFIEPARGRILIDDIDVQTIDLHELRAKVAWISQAPQLFSGTVLDNIIDGDIFRHIAQEEIAQAVNAANVSEFLNRLPAGMTSLIGEGGNTLSGGQKQRLAIARALVKNAPLICMDEPTSALDSRSESYIKQALPQLTAGKTVLLVTHRRPLLDMMDEIYVMEAGQLRKIEGRDGLEHYLAAISGEEAHQRATREDEKARDEQAEKLLREQQRIAALRAENAKLQQDLSIASNRPPADEGTIYIDH
jgi:ABC-type bacteriocin/lantibiotic exporter with double-glycine peptidase domain